MYFEDAPQDGLKNGKCADRGDRHIFQNLKRNSDKEFDSVR
jgi:hypothetical protein